MPAAIFKLLPASITGGGGAEKASYILETSVVDMREGWMRTESRNLNFVGVLSVVERQLYSPRPASGSATTDVATTVVFRSRLGERIRGRLSQAAAAATSGNEDGSRPGFFARLGTHGIQRSIESLASTKTQDQLGKSREGMGLILERLRQSGVRGVLELRRAREPALEVA
jgi:hypothetical protein